MPWLAMSEIMELSGKVMGRLEKARERRQTEEESRAALAANPPTKQFFVNMATLSEDERNLLLMDALRRRWGKADEVP